MTTPEDPFATPGGEPTPSQPPAYGQPPASGQPPAYGQPPAGQPPAYQPPAYGQQPYGQPASTGWSGPPLASWGQRVQSAMIDWFGPIFVATLVRLLISAPLGWLLTIAAIAWALYNAYQAGATGQSIGKKSAGIRLLREQDGQVIGGGLGIGRYFVHIVDTLPCYIGLLWPLWDAKKQTFADKILKTVVIQG